MTSISGRVQPARDRETEPERASDAHAAARARVLETAERLFREYGYQKTTVADIARALGMSPANVYRFYESKRAIFEAVAFKLLQVVETALAAVAEEAAPAADRLRRFLLRQNELSTQYFVGDSRIRDMVEVAVNERWDAIAGHAETVRRMLARIIRDGVAEGAFACADPDMAAACVMTGWVRFCHPVIMNVAEGDQGPTPEDMAAFLMAALRPAAAGGG
ncbi:TetR/AcrR family transcriptional regulator [Camelimonas abortus]|uniref:TetR/AcrR family transcriptional regulator n=1 Tax=Camelimonas abortus TaxID=1017184 RepID=A0ABV7LFL2_9HYPH